MINITLVVRKVHDGFIIYRKGTEKHSHFRSKEAANKFKRLIVKGIRPKSPYYIESARRLLTPKELSELHDEHKQKYVNRGYRCG